MEIQDLIDRDYCSASMLEDMHQMGEWLNDRNYFAMVDEGLQIVGILTIRDFFCNQHHQAIDCDFSKPAICSSESLYQVLSRMLLSRKEYLPVYEGSFFIGVISIWSLTQRLLANV